MQIQETTAKKPRTKESRPEKAKLIDRKAPTLSCSESTKSDKIFCIDKNREYLQKKQDLKNNILATEDNTNTIEGNKKIQNNHGIRRYYNCQKGPSFKELPKISK